MWQTIDSAPKDGTWILLYQDGMIRTSHWQDESYQTEELIKETKRGDRTYRTVTVDSGYWAQADDIYDPTHWQPLPTPLREVTEGEEVCKQTQ